MPTLTYPATLIAGQPENVNDLNNNLAAIQNTINGLDAANLANSAVTADKLETTLAQKLGVTNAANIGRGKTIIPTTETRTATTFGLMTTPDQVAGIVLPTDGYIDITYRAIWLSSVAGAGRAAIFLGANQLQIPTLNSTTPTGAQASTAGVVNNWLTTHYGLALVGTDGTTTGMEGQDATTTGLVIGAKGSNYQTGGSVRVEAAAGTYTVSVQFSATSGSVTVRSRKLWVEAKGF